jgi:hypothetical protein
MKRFVVSIAVTLCLAASVGCHTVHHDRWASPAFGSYTPGEHLSAKLDEFALFREGQPVGAYGPGGTGYPNRWGHGGCAVPHGHRHGRGGFGDGDLVLQPAPNGPVGAVAYPYYTHRGPRDFLVNNPPSIGP